MKQIALLLTIALLSTMFGTIVLAEETPEETVVAEEIEELQEEKQAAAPPEVLSVTADKSAVKPGEAVQFTVETTGEAKYLALFSENGTKCKVWGMTGNSEVYGGNRKWTVSYAFKSAGEREITFRAAATKTYGPDSGKVRVSVQREPVTIELSMGGNLTFCETYVSPIILSFKASPNVTNIAAYAENGTRIKTMVSSHYDYTSSYDPYSIWYIKFDVKNPGVRTLTFKATADGKTYGAKTEVTMRVEPWTYSAVPSATEAKVGETVTFTVTTHKNAKYLLYINGGDKHIKVWKAAGNSAIVDRKRVWTIRLTPTYAGRANEDYRRLFYFIAGLTADSFDHISYPAPVYIRVLPKTTE